MEKCILITFVILSLKIGGELIEAQNVTDNVVTKNIKCASIDCVHSAARIIEKMNSNANPCEDFYEYACGGFISEVYTPDEKSTVNTLFLMNDKLQEYLLTIYSKPSSDSDPLVYRVSKTLYKTCLNVDEIDRRGKQPLEELIEKIGGWPLLSGDKWDEKSWDWEKVLLGLRQFAAKKTNNIFKGEANDLLDKDDIWIQLEDEEDQMLKGEDKLSEDQLVLLFKTYIIDVVKRLLQRELSELEEQRIFNETREIIEFEFKLRDYLNYFKERNQQKVKSTASRGETFKARSFYNYTIWLNLFSPFPLSTLNNTYVKPFPLKQLTKKFLNFLTKETPKRVRANYITWRIVQFSLNFLSDRLRGPTADFNKFAFGKEDIEQRWRECLFVVAENAPVSTGALYINDYFKKKDKEEAEKMVDYIIAEYLDTIKKVEWMDERTRTDALNKAKTMARYIGYHEKLTDLETTNNYYRGFKIPENKFFEQILGLKVFDTDRDYENLFVANSNDWTKYSIPATTNAYYNKKDNSIQFPAAILQSPFYSRTQPNYLNYGGIGSVIGHEITHSFDNLALNSGNWAQEAREKYNDGIQCLIKEYSKFRSSNVEELLGDGTPFYLNGEKTIREDIADNGGVKLAYNAYRKWIQENGEEMSLIGISHNPYQLFWLAFAQSYCSVERAIQMKHKIETDEHTLDKFRILGTVVNMPDFARDFNCQANSPMNPVSKCAVW